jgi:protein SCO1/2
LKKKLYLFLALLLPALLFVFLKYAGKNEFNIPVYYETGVAGVSTECGSSYPVPYLLPDSVQRGLGTGNREANILVFFKPGLDFNKLKSRMEDEFGLEEVAILEFCNSTEDSLNCVRLKKCVFLLNDPWETVLVDSKGRIRGYYDLISREEQDRLRVELKVLLKKY